MTRVEELELLAHAGTFDVENYGDLLFPRVVQSHLSGYQFVSVSPCGGAPVWQDCVTSEGLEELLHKAPNGVVVGGGNIIHPNKTPLDTYTTAGVDIYGYADLWIGATLAAPDEVPVVWNAPGVPRAIPTEFIDIARAALERANYLSVRDASSRNFLLDICPDLGISLVPDSAWDLPTLWTNEELDTEFAALTEGREGPFLSIHLNDRYTKDIEKQEIAAIIDAVAQDMGATPILIAIGPCHQDDELASEIAPMLRNKCILLGRPQSTRQVCAVVSKSKLYAGSSMHGYITAAAFGVPALLVAQNLVKFSGAVRQAGAPDTLVASWREVQNTLSGFDLVKLAKKFSQNQISTSKTLSDHWSKISSILESAPTGSPWSAEKLFRYRARFLNAACQKEAMSALEYKEIAERLRKQSKKAKSGNQLSVLTKIFG